MDSTTLLLTFAPVVIIGLVIYFMLRSSKQGSANNLSDHPHEINQEARIKQLEDRISELEKRSK